MESIVKDGKIYDTLFHVTQDTVGHTPNVVIPIPVSSIREYDEIQLVSELDPNLKHTISVEEAIERSQVYEYLFGIFMITSENGPIVNIRFHNAIMGPLQEGDDRVRFKIVGVRSATTMVPMGAGKIYPTGEIGPLGPIPKQYVYSSMIPKNGPISFDHLRAELGISTKVPISLGDVMVRSLYDPINAKEDSNSHTEISIESLKGKQHIVNPDILEELKFTSIQHFNERIRDIVAERQGNLSGINISFDTNYLNMRDLEFPPNVKSMPHLISFIGTSGGVYELHHMMYKCVEVDRVPYHLLTGIKGGLRAPTSPFYINKPVSYAGIRDFRVDFTNWYQEKPTEHSGVFHNAYWSNEKTYNENSLWEFIQNWVNVYTKINPAATTSHEDYHVLSDIMINKFWRSVSLTEERLDDVINWVKEGNVRFRGLFSYSTIDRSQVNKFIASVVGYESMNQGKYAEVENINRMFAYCENLQRVHLHKFLDLMPNLRNTGQMFLGCKNVTVVNLYHFPSRYGFLQKNNKLTSTYGMFQGCHSLEYVPHNYTGDVHSLTSSTHPYLKDVSSMFSKCYALRIKLPEVWRNTNINQYLYYGYNARKTINYQDIPDRYK